MPFFWVGGFGGVLSALSAGATLVTEEVPTPESTLNLIVSEKVTLFRAGPIRRCRWPRWPPTQARTCRRSPTAACPRCSPELRPRPGARANLFGMTESFGPYCGFHADRDMPESAWGSCGKPFDGVEVRIADPVTGAPLGPGESGEIQLRGKRILQGICGRTRERLHRRPRLHPTGDLGQF